MRLGEALGLRSDLQKRIAQLTPRLQASAVVQSGDRPPEDPNRLLAELRTMTEELEALVAQINLTNATTEFAAGRTITEALARRDVLGLRGAILRAAADAVSQAQARYSRSELRLERHIDVAAVRREIDELARERRELDTEIQERNWTTDLVENTSR